MPFNLINRNDFNNFYIIYCFNTSVNPRSTIISLLYYVSNGVSIYCSKKYNTKNRMLEKINVKDRAIISLFYYHLLNESILFEKGKRCMLWTQCYIRNIHKYHIWIGNQLKMNDNVIFWIIYLNLLIFKLWK